LNQDGAAEKQSVPVIAGTHQQVQQQQQQQQQQERQLLQARVSQLVHPYTTRVGQCELNFEINLKLSLHERLRRQQLRFQGIGNSPLKLHC
jgi:hypothetical protein